MRAEDDAAFNANKGSGHLINAEDDGKNCAFTIHKKLHMKGKKAKNARLQYT